MESKLLRRKNLNLLNFVVIFLAALTVLLFLFSYVEGFAFAGDLLKVFGIFYLIGLILILLAAHGASFSYLRINTVEKPVYIKEKKKPMKKFTGSSYRKVYHRRSCRFSESIKDKYFEENDDREFFVKKKYSPCGLCKPNVKREIMSDDIKEDKKA